MLTENNSKINMFRASKIVSYPWQRLSRANRAPIYTNVPSRGSHLQNQQVFNAINQHLMDNTPQPFMTFLKVTGIVVGTIASYSVYQVCWKGEETFVPFYVSKSKRLPTNADRIDEKLVKLTAHEQLLERLSMSEVVHQDFKLPITLSELQEFELWIEEKYTSIKGVEISPHKPHFQRVDKPLKVPKLKEGVLEPMGADDSFEVPVINQDERDYDILFSGKANVTGKLGNEGKIVFKGIFDSEHIKQAQLRKLLLIREVDGKKKKDIIW